MVACVHYKISCLVDYLYHDIVWLRHARPMEDSLSNTVYVHYKTIFVYSVQPASYDGGCILAFTHCKR